MRSTRRRGSTHPAHVQLLINTGAALPDKHHLAIPESFAVHAQGTRGTCCGHAVTACHEFVTGACYRFDDIFLSEWDDDRERHIGDRFCGATLKDTVANVERDGQRPVGRRGDAETQAFVRVREGSVRDARLRLLGGSPIAVSLDLFGSWQETRGGRVTCEIASSSSSSEGEKHAVAVVGFRLDDDAEGGGWFTFVNSWGSDWGRKGFGELSFAFFESCCSEAYAAVSGREEITHFVWHR